MSEKNKKITIISLLCVIIVLLSILLFTGNGKSKTVMIYMVGSDLESKFGIATSDLNGIVPKNIDLDKTKVLLYTGGTSEWKNYISNEENAIYLLEKDGFKKIQTYKKENMGSPYTLSNFLNYSYDNYKSDIYDLILYDHGGALHGAIYDDFTNDNLSLSDFSEAFKNSPFNSENKLDVILFRTCLNGTIEVANVFKDYANYLVSSEEVSYGASGYSVLGFLNEVKNITGVEYGKRFINHYDKLMNEIDEFGFNNITYSIIDLSKIDSLNIELNKFINELQLENNYKDILKIRSNLLQYAGTETGNYDTVDLYSLVDGLSIFSAYDNKKLLSLIEDTVVYNYSNDKDSSHGLAIYFPYNGEDAYQKYFLNIYKNLNYSESYKTFINNIYNFRKNGQSASLLNKDLTNKITSQSGNVSMTLDNESVKDYSAAILNIYVKTKDYPNTPKNDVDGNIYSLIYTTTNGSLNGNKLDFKLDKNFVEIYDDKTYGYISVIERAGTGDQPERVFGAFGRLGLFPNTIYTKFYFEYKNDEPVIRLATYSNEDENSSRVYGNVLNINDYDDLYFNVYAYRFDANGNETSYIDSKYDSTLLNYKMEWHEKIKLLKLRKATYYDNVDYYAKITIHDIYGNTKDTKLVKINK